ADQAEAMPAATAEQASAALAVWRQAADALGQAVSAVSAGEADEALRRRVAEARLRLERGRERADAALARASGRGTFRRALDGARMARWVWAGRGFDVAGASGRYAAAFAAFGLEVQAGRPEEVARRVRDQEPQVREAILVALYDWASCEEHRGG